MKTQEGIRYTFPSPNTSFNALGGKEDASFVWKVREIQGPDLVRARFQPIKRDDERVGSPLETEPTFPQRWENAIQQLI